jgi:hypothetical protein
MLRRRRWHYREELALPPDLDLEGLEVTRSFLHKTVRVYRTVLRRTFRYNCERVLLETTGRGTLECSALPRALAVVEPPDEVKVVELEILTGRHDEAVVVHWRADGTSHAEVTGRSRTWVLGVHGVLERFVRERQYEISEPTPASWRRQGWFSGISIQVAATVIGGGVLALIGLAWTIVT